MPKCQGSGALIYSTIHTDSKVTLYRVRFFWCRYGTGKHSNPAPVLCHCSPGLCYLSILMIGINDQSLKPIWLVLCSVLNTISSAAHLRFHFGILICRSAPVCVRDAMPLFHHSPPPSPAHTICSETRPVSRNNRLITKAVFCMQFC